MCFPNIEKRQKPFSDRTTGLTGSFKKFPIDILFIKQVLWKGFLSLVFTLLSVPFFKNVDQTKIALRLLYANRILPILSSQKT
jgi:hypothetical protein